MRQTKRKTEKHILIIDDTLDMEMKKHGLARYDRISDALMMPEANADIHVRHVTNLQSAIYYLEDLKEQRVDPEDVTVICDYKLQPSDGPAEWGPDILQQVANNPHLKPAKIFLMSKSGFRSEDQQKLDAVSAEYFHTNELFFAAAHAHGNEALKEVFSQRAKTTNFREWFNREFGTQLELGAYESPNVAEKEKGRVPVIEVIRRVREEKIKHAEAFQLIDENSVRDAFRTCVQAEGIDPAQAVPIHHGIEGPSVAGKLAFSLDDIERIRAQEPTANIVLALDHDYAPADHAAIVKSNALVMLASGTQHIPVLARNMNIPVLFANREKYPDLSIKDGQLLKHEGLLAPTAFAKPGDEVTVDGTTHTLYTGTQKIISPGPRMREAAQELARMGDYNARLTWHFKSHNDKLVDHTGVGVMVNADNAQQVAAAKKMPGVRGVGLLRTEHMLSDEQRILLVKALVAEGKEKQAALSQFTQAHTHDLAAVLSHQSSDFPISIRLFDFPPAEFFPDPSSESAIASMAQKAGVDIEKLRAFSRRVHEENLRGPTLMEEFPELAEAQTKAIFEAATLAQAEPKVMIPLVRTERQFRNLQQKLQATAQEKNTRFKLGIMVETRELCPDGYSDELAKPLTDIVRHCDFISLGTNDLTEELLDLRRGDIEGVLKWNQQSREGINPFAELASEVRSGIERITYFARQANPKIEMTLCGDQATARSTAESAQYYCIDALSVPATPEMVTQGLVETGRAALLENYRESEKREAERRSAREAEEARQSGKLPEGTTVPSKHVLHKSPVAFILIEDDHYMLERFEEALAGLPVVLCGNMNDALNTIDALRSQGKEIKIYADANVPMLGYSETGESIKHPFLEQLGDYLHNGWDRLTPGPAMAWAIADGHIAGLTPHDIRILSFSNNDDLPEGTLSFSKSGSYTCDWLRQEMEDVVALSQARKVRQEKCVVIVDDEPEWGKQAAKEIELRFNCPVEVISNPAQALERVKQGGVAAVLADQFMPEITGEQLLEQLKTQAPELPAAIITGSDEFLEAVYKEGPTEPGQVLPMHKDEAGHMQYSENRLRQFLSSVFNGGPGIAV